MKVEVTYLWDTTRELLSYVGEEFDRPQSIEDLVKCENVLVHGQIDGRNSPYDISIDGHNYLVSPTKVKHCGGTMLILEVY